MAINVNNVYQTVLLVLNKEQRGYITPDEFNKTATQVQLDIFEMYFDSLNQQLRVDQADFDYSNRQLNLDNNISQFKCIGDLTYSAGIFSLPLLDNLTSLSVVYNDNPQQDQISFYRLGTVTYDGGTSPIEIQRVQRENVYKIQKSDLAAPTEDYPVYLYESGALQVLPSTILADVSCSFIRKPRNVIWAYTPGPQGQYIQDVGNSQDFEINSNDQVELILKILQYSGIVIRDPQIIQAAAAEVAQNEVNQKS
jgi:hypothetical protein